MAFFHYKVQLVPANIAEICPDYISQSIDEQSADEDEINPWVNQPSPQLLSALRNLLPNDMSWGPCEEFVSDSLLSSDLRIWHDEQGNVDEIEFRFAPGEDDIELLIALAEIANEHRCIFEYVGIARTAREFFGPEQVEILRHFRNSKTFEQYLNEQRRNELSAKLDALLMHG